MSKEGYLIHHTKPLPYQVRYCVISGGALQIFTERNSAILLEEIHLSCTRVRVSKAIELDEKVWPNAFRVHIQRSKVCAGRVIGHSAPIVRIFSAPNMEERKCWSAQFSSWQRMYWTQPQHQLEIRSEEEADIYFKRQRSELLRALEVEQKVRTENSVLHLLYRSAVKESKDPAFYGGKNFPFVVSLPTLQDCIPLLPAREGRFPSKRIKQLM